MHTNDTGYDIGDIVKLHAVLQDSDTEEYLEPGVLTLKIKSPTGTQTNYVYGTDPEITKESTGRYLAEVEPDVPGAWGYRWVSTITNKAAQAGKFFVRTNEFS